MTSIMECQAISKKYGSKKVIGSLSVALEQGKIYGLIGPNGMGKSTLIKMMAGILKPTKGRILFNGKKYRRTDRKYVSYMSEQFMLYDFMTVREHMAFASKIFQDWDDSRAERLISLLNISENENIGKLSKGFKTRVQMAMTLSRKSKVYLLDEPLSGIDPSSRERIVQAVLSEFGQDNTFVISTHLIQDVESLLDYVFFMNNGEIVLSGEADELRHKYDGSIRHIFLELFG